LDKASLDALFNLRGKVELGLGPMNRLLEALGHPESGSRIIHLAGTNGKGSTLAGLETLFLASGYTTGAFISPHLVHFNERFRLNGQPASDALVDAALEQVCAALGVSVAGLGQTSEKELGASFFEISFAMALLILKGADWLLVETGLGGRLDATNALQHPLATVITRIGFDHMDYLGQSLPEITGEKLGIFKPGAAAFLAPQEPEVVELARSKALELGVPLWEADRQSLAGMPLGLAGRHQEENLATSLLVYRQLCPPERRLDPNAEARALASVRWAGRLERVGENLLLDGAHNAQGLAALLAYLKEFHGGKKILLGLGWMTGKNLLEGFDGTGLDLTFLPLAGGFFQAEPDPRNALVLLGPCLAPHSPKAALGAWRAGGFKDFDLVVFSGSLYLVGQFKSLLG